jgi:hypothetical protein
MVSYPRSGNTYLRALVANYLSGLDRPLSLAELTAAYAGEHNEALWRELTGQPAAERSLETEWAARPGYFAQLRASPDRPNLLIKSHTVNAALAGQPAFTWSADDRIVHVVRHPCDVAVSSADFYGISTEEAVQRLLTPGFLIDGRPGHGYEVMGSWEQHTRSWGGPVGVPVHRLRYRDMVDDPAQALRDLMVFLGAPADERRIQAAVIFSRFEILQIQEEISGFAEASPDASSGRFFRAGRTQQWRENLSRDQAARLFRAHEELIDLLGFTQEPVERRAVG